MIENVFAQQRFMMTENPNSQIRNLKQTLMTENQNSEQYNRSVHERLVFNLVRPFRGNYRSEAKASHYTLVNNLYKLEEKK
jgi:hypothetical protein